MPQRGPGKVGKGELGVVACGRLVAGAGLGQHSRNSHLVARSVRGHTVAGGAGAGVAGVAGVAAGMVMAGAV